MNIKLLKAQYQLVTENGYIDPNNSEFEPEVSEIFDFVVDFFDHQYFFVKCWWEGDKLRFDTVELYDCMNKLQFKIDPDYLDELLNENIVRKIYQKAYEWKGY